MLIQLNNNYSLTVQPHLKGVRLIVLDNGNEYVCRKESFKNLTAFMALTEGQIFKGRLQLHKYHQNITVQVKGKALGTITLDHLKAFIPA